MEEYQEVETEKKKDNNDNTLVLELGDIIEIIAPANKDIHEMTAIITYIDNTKLLLINITSSKHYQFNLTEDGNFTDESITEVHLLNRSDSKGYARQNNLLPKTWTDIYFGGEIPVILTGEITNLENDMIELTTYPDLDVIYIDFEYKGIPENIPIEKIIIRQKPASLKKLGSLSLVKQQIDDGELRDVPDESMASMEFTDTGESIIRIPEDAEEDINIRDTLKELYIDANAIVFGEQLEDITQLVEVPEGEQRYGVETQVNDLMDELLSTIPNSQRTKRVLDNIHLLIERFKQLRSTFSKFDENENIYDTKTIGAYYKPLVERIHKLDTNLRWILPVVSNRKKIYDEAIEIETSDVLQEKSSSEIRRIEKIQKEYYSIGSDNNSIDYSTLNRSIQNIMLPIDKPLDSDKLLTNKEIMTDIESVVDNLDDFYSTVIKKDNVSKRKFVIQKYNLGLNKMEQRILKSGKKTYTSIPMTPNDTISIKSLIMLPASVMRYSKIYLPGTNILEKTTLHQNQFLLFRILKQNTDIIPNIIDDLEKELDYEKMEKEEKMEFLTGLQEFVLNDDFNNEDDKFQKLLEIIIPKTRILIRLVRKYIKDKLSFVECVKFLEPFMIYQSDITYKQYMEIRYFIKERIIELKKDYSKKSNEFGILRSYKYNISQEVIKPILRILNEKKEFFDIFVNAYKFETGDKTLVISSQELLAKMVTQDYGNLYTNLITSLLISLMTPNNLIDVLSKPNIDDMGDLEKIKPGDCARRYLSKKYDSLTALQKDNNVDELYFDNEYDDTPYDILKKYKDEQKKMLPENFVDYLAENLIQKHDCPPEVAKELASTLIAGKKIIRDDDYAILELKPKLPSNIDINALNDKEKAEIEVEANIRTKIQYYRRLKNNWIHDDIIDENSFLDTNTLFCNVSKECFKNTRNNICEPVDNAEHRMKELMKKKMLNEFDKRYTINVEELEKQIEKNIEYYLNMLSKTRRLIEIKEYKANNLSYELGKLSTNEEIIESPYIHLRDMIMSQSDFSKKQTDIVRFFEKFCREPMMQELKEHAQWKYCKDTNTKLLPKFIYELAIEFVNGADYERRLAEICHSNGILSDDGDSIVDKYSGFIIRKRDFTTEEGFDEAGFRITTHSIIEKDLGTVFLEKIGKIDDRPIFENALSEMIYNVFSSIASNIDIPIEGISEFILRTSTELIEKTIKTKDFYEGESAKILKEKGKKRAPYKKYRNELIIIIISSLLFISIQTAIPSFQAKKTFAGCVRSLTGFPMSGVEDITGIQYIACVLNKMKIKNDDNIEPWDGIKNSNVDILSKQLKEYIEKVVLKRNDVVELYVKKREYLLVTPEIQESREHSITKWVHFLPPVVDYSVSNTTRNISPDFKREFLELLRKGSKDQHNDFNIIKSRASKFGYLIIENINHIVKAKDLLLKTSSKIPFMENACCNENTNLTNPISYFIHEDENIKVIIHNTNQLSLMINDLKLLSKASILYHPYQTGIKYPEVPICHLEENIYNAFIKYCNFDRNLPIPEEYKSICNEKPANYSSLWTLQEKVEFLKKNGKRYTVENLNQLMKLVNQKNIITIPMKEQFSKVDVMKDLIDKLDLNNCGVIDDKLREHVHKVMDKFNPKVMMDMDSDELQDLKEYLYTTNDLLYRNIMDFFKRYGNINNTKYNNLSIFLASLTKWNTVNNNLDGNLYYDEEIYAVSQYIQNAVYSMSKVFPSIILNNSTHNTVPEHWGLFPNDENKVNIIIKNYYDVIEKFKNDAVISRLLMEATTNLVDLNIFTQNIPIITPIIKNNISFHSLFDKKTIYALLLYSFYSVISEYICLSDDNDLLRIDIENFKQSRREKKIENNIPSTSLQGKSENLDENLEEYEDDLEEKEIVVGNKKALRERVCELLLAFLDIEEKNKKAINFSYSDISHLVKRSKNKEKQSIIDSFEGMTIETRRVENQLKQYKIGRWNVGMQKGLVHYDGETNDRESNDLFAQLKKDIEEGETDVISEFTMDIYGLKNTNEDMIDVDDLQKYQDNENDEFYNEEAYGISNLGEDYNDGQYYEEDIDRDDY